jgi:hypothetical protein
MGQGVNTPEPTIPVVLVNVVPIRAIDHRSSQRTLRGWPKLEHAQFGCARTLGVLIEVGFELGQHEFDGSERRLHFRLPCGEGVVERRHHCLHGRDMLIASLLFHGEPGEVLVDGVEVHGESALDLLLNLLDLLTYLLQQIFEQQLQVGVHAIESLLPTRVVVVVF